MTGTSLREIFSLRANSRRFFVPPPGQLAALDGFRALSILFVVLFHSFYLTQQAFREYSQFSDFVQGVPAWLTWVWHGDKGVDMFFILSGFLITGILLRERQRSGGVNTARFYTHRALRILPVYIFAILLIAPSNKNGDYFWANLLFINNLLPLDKMLIPWSWSLSIEVQFYALFPFLLLFLLRRRRPLLWLGALLSASLLIRYGVILLNPELYRQPMYLLTTQHPDATLLYFDKLYVNLPTRMAPLILGVIIAWLVHFHDDALRTLLRRQQVLFNVIALIAVLLVIAIVQTPVFDPAVGHGTAFNLHYMALSKPLFSLGMAAILLYALYGVGLGRPVQLLLSLRIWYPLSQAAYSMYLFHIFFVFAAYYLLLDGKTDFAALSPAVSAAAFLLAVLFSLVFSYLVYLLLERPLINLYRKPRQRG